MSDLNSETQLSRRAFLKAGGALVIAFNLGEAISGPAHAAAARVGVAGPPDPNQIDTWLAIHADNTATLYIGYVELGQGTTTALPQVAAEELDFDIDQVSTVSVDTHLSPNQGGTYSSASIARGSPAVRQAAAEARQALLQMASKKLKAPVEQLSVSRGVVSVGGDSRRSISYGKLVGGKRFNLAFTGAAPVKPSTQYKTVGIPAPRKDIPAKVDGSYTYIQHLRLPGMLHGRIVRPRGQRAYAAGAKVIWLDHTSIDDIKGARLLRKGDFIGVVARTEWDAIRAARQLKIMWEDARLLPGKRELFAQMRAERTENAVIAEKGNIDSAFEGAAYVASQTCWAPYQSHATFAPNCALADVRRDSALVICSSQDVYNARRTLAPLLGLPEEKIRVQYCEASGTYGHSCYDDVAQAAAIMSQLAKRPVRVQFMRWDEHGWDTYGPAHVGKAKVAADRRGKIIAYRYDGWQHNWSLTEASAQLATSAPAAEWPLFMSQQVNPLVCGGQYKIDNLQLTNHRVPGGAYLRGAWLRSPLDLSFAFASEQAVDALAYKLKKDPYEFRKSNIADERWEGVLDAAAKAANWKPRRAALKLSKANVVSGRGIGLGTHLQSWGGAVAEIEVDKASGRVAVKHLYGAIDAGCTVNPGNVEAQIVGQLVQTASRMLFEEVTFNEREVTSLDWGSYPVIRFEDCPQVTPIVVQRVNERSLGAGEEVMAAAAAAIANAFFDATGVRMREYPFTPARVLETLKKNGKS